VGGGLAAGFEFGHIVLTDAFKPNEEGKFSCFRGE